MTLSGEGTPRDDIPPGRRTPLWSLVLGLVTAVAIIGLMVGAIGAPRWVLLVLVAVAATCGLGSMVLAVLCLLPGKDVSKRARRQAFAGAALGSLVLLGIALVASSALVIDSQAGAALTKIAAQLQKTLQAQQRCISAAQNSGASQQAAFDRCTRSPAGCSTTRPIQSEAVFCATGTSYATSTNIALGSVLVLLIWAALVLSAGWLLFRPRDPPPLAGATP